MYIKVWDSTEARNEAEDTPHLPQTTQHKIPTTPSPFKLLQTPMNREHRQQTRSAIEYLNADPTLSSATKESSISLLRRLARVCYLYLVSRYMQPKVPWERLRCRRRSDGGIF